METEIEAFVSEWMRKNSHVLEEVVLLQGDDATTRYGASLHAYLRICCDENASQPPTIPPGP
jgi:hypothetical protein